VVEKHGDYGESPKKQIAVIQNHHQKHLEMNNIIFNSLKGF
jgi:hypothetical protein